MLLPASSLLLLSPSLLIFFLADDAVPAAGSPLSVCLDGVLRSLRGVLTVPLGDGASL